MASAPGVSLRKGDAKWRGTMDLFRASLTAATFLALYAPGRADPALGCDERPAHFDEMN
jgi:hypothetical protein